MNILDKFFLAFVSNMDKNYILLINKTICDKKLCEIRTNYRIWSEFFCAELFTILDFFFFFLQDQSNTKQKYMFGPSVENSVEFTQIQFLI